jgi:tryptophan-rich sensory protein
MILALIGFIGLCLLVGAADGAIVGASVRTWYLSLTQPPGTPPNWLFAVVWTGLYIMMGVAAWLVWRRNGAGWPLRLWGWHLLLNAMWTPAFFGLQNTLLGLLVVVPLVVMVCVTTRAFLGVSRWAGGLMLPYAVWSLYAAYLNFGFWWLNGSALG